ncbi:MAG: hypothetical protein E7Z66_03805 [Thermoplasmata archaeon]|nr:hypothetical protein [Thermoplasmata archaeon]
MSDRRCPSCGEKVPSFSVTCPKCYKSIPRDEPKEKPNGYKIIDDDRAPSIRTVNRKTVLILALIPGALGLMGLGQIYQKDYRKGFMFMIIGILLMTSIVSLMTGSGGALSVILTVFSIIMFIGAYLIQAFDAFVRSLFSFRF